MKYYLWILGCAMNYSDAERISSVLDSLGYERTYHENESDLFIVISCSVRQSAINRIYGKVKDLREVKKQNANFTTILSGCVLAEDKKKMKKGFDLIFEIKDLDKLPEMLKSVIPAKAGILKKDGSLGLRQGMTGEGLAGEYLSITPQYESIFRAYVPISTGCDNFCTYCAVPYTRGREKSRPLPEIVGEVQELVKKGYKEITLLGQNVNSYGNDLKDDLSTNFAQLLLEIDKISGDYRVYFYSNHPKDMSNDLIGTLAKLEHFPHYIHLPLQSGNNEIIKKMNRHHTRKQYLDLVKEIRKAMPDVVLTTDIIVGFPGETEEQFADTVDVMKKVKYDMAFIAQYSQRPGTVAAKMLDNVTKEEKRAREDVLQKILANTSFEHNQKLVGTVQKVLIDGKKGSKYFGRTTGYKVVEIKTDRALELGQFIDVKIDSASTWKLLGTTYPRVD